MSWDALFGLAGSAYGAYMDYKGVEAMNAANAQIAERQMAFQRESFQNRHQWEVEDLRKAGLNPILSAGGQPPVLGGAAIPAQNKAAGFKELGVATAKMLSEISLNKELARTEMKKQDLVSAQIDAAQGTVSIPGFANMPINRLGRLFTSAASVDANTKASGDAFRSGKSTAFRDRFNSWFSK